MSAAEGLQESINFESGLETKIIKKKSLQCAVRNGRRQILIRVGGEEHVGTSPIHSRQTIFSQERCYRVDRGRLGGYS